MGPHLYLRVPDTHSPPFQPHQRYYSPTLLFFFLFSRHVIPPPSCTCPAILKPKRRPAPVHSHPHSHIPEPPEPSLCPYPIHRERRVSRADVRFTRRSFFPRVAPQDGRARRTPDQQRAGLAERTDGLAAIRVRDAGRRAREQPAPALAPRLRALTPSRRRHAADMEPPKPVRLAPLCRAGTPPHARLLRTE